MENNSENGSIKKKRELLRKYFLLGSLAREYSDHKKTLRAINRMVKGELAKLRKSKYAVTGTDFRDAMRFGEDLSDVVARLIRAKKVESYRIAAEALDGYLIGISEASESLVEKKTDVRQMIDAALGKAKLAGEALEKKAGEALERVKKTMAENGLK